MIDLPPDPSADLPSDLSADPSADPSAGQRALALESVRWSAFVFLGIFLISVCLRAIPIRLADPVWQVQMVGILVDMGGYALLAVVVLILVSLFDSQDEGFEKLMDRVIMLC